MLILSIITDLHISWFVCLRSLQKVYQLVLYSLLINIISWKTVGFRSHTLLACFGHFVDNATNVTDKEYSLDLLKTFFNIDHDDFYLFISNSNLSTLLSVQLITSWRQYEGPRLQNLKNQCLILAAWRRLAAAYLLYRFTWHCRSTHGVIPCRSCSAYFKRWTITQIHYN